jgi:alkyl hydroperoxide reductase subunit AhpC
MNDLPVGRSVDEALRLVQAFQFTVSLSFFFWWMSADVVLAKDAHGEVCPANWKEGSRTIRADPLAKLDYFSAANGAHENDIANGIKRARMDAD